jgi:hypothetical protein
MTTPSPSRLSRAAALLLLLVAFAALGGCEGGQSKSAADGENEYGSAECDVDVDCGTGLVCQFGFCTALDDDTRLISLRLSPPGFRSDLITQQVVDVPVSFGRPLPDFALTSPIQLSGVITWAGNGPVPGSADVRFRRVGGITGLEYATNVSTPGLAGDFTVLLPPGFYDVSIAPAFGNLPRYAVQNIEVNAQGVDACPGDLDRFCQLWSYALPRPEDHLTVTGVVEQRINGMIVPLDGVLVGAQSVDGLVQSSEALTDVDGRFVVFLPPQTRDYQFRVRAEGRGASSIPTLDFSTVTVSPENEASLNVVLSAGDLPPAVRVEGQVTVPSGAGTADALVLIEGRFAEAPDEPGAAHVVSATVSVTLGAEELTPDGRFSVALPPGSYEVVAASTRPGLGVTDAASLRVEAGEPTDGSSGGLLLTLPPTVAATGRVVDALGTGVSGASLSARLVRVAGRPASVFGVTQTLLGATAQTDAFGNWEMDLAPGQYELSVTAPAESGLAPSLVTARVIPSGSTVDVTLSPGGVVVGRVLAPEGAPLGGAVVEAWEGNSSTPRLLYSTVADEDGLYRLVLPASEGAGADEDAPANGSGVP